MRSDSAPTPIPSPEDLAASLVGERIDQTDEQRTVEIARLALAIRSDRESNRAAIVRDVREVAKGMASRPDAVAVVARRTLTVLADRIERGSVLLPAAVKLDG